MSASLAPQSVAPRLRAVRPDETAPHETLPAQPGVYRLPPHVVSELQLDVPLGTALTGYLVLVPDGVAPQAVPSPQSDGLSVDPEQRIAHLDGEQLDLTYLEFELLAHLVGNPHRVHTRDRLVESVWGYGHIGDGRTVDVHVARLRRKLGPAYRGRIVTVRRVGYKYVPLS
jgi:hypothetical protein